MTEPRMRQRQKGAQFPDIELEAFLYTHGSVTPAPKQTLTCLDAIITDFIIETCHEAAVSASLAGRAKIKLDDFKFMLRKDEEKLGRVQELQTLKKNLDAARKTFDGNVVSKEEERGERVGRGRGKRKRKSKGKGKGGEEEDGEDEEEEAAGKGRKKRARSEDEDGDE